MVLFCKKDCFSHLPVIGKAGAMEPYTEFENYNAML